MPPFLWVGLVSHALDFWDLNHEAAEGELQRTSQDGEGGDKLADRPGDTGSASTQWGEGGQGGVGSQPRARSSHGRCVWKSPPWPLRSKDGTLLPPGSLEDVPQTTLAATIVSEL